MVKEEELLRRYADEHCEQAFAQFVHLHINLVYATALRRLNGDKAAAHDVTQTVFTHVARCAGKLASHPALAGWLHTTTRHQATRAWRNRVTRQRYEDQAAIQHMIDHSNEEDWAKLWPVIDETLDALPSKDRDALVARFFESQSFAQIGASIHASPDAARMRVERALQKLQTALKRRGINSVAGALAAVLGTQASIAAPAGLTAAVSTAALSGVAGSTAAVTFLSFMTGTKLYVGSATLAAVLATGIAVLEHQQANIAEKKFAETERSLAALQNRLVTAERQISAAEKQAAEAELDSGALLNAIDSARATDLQASRSAQPPPKPGDPAAEALYRLFPNGIIATVGGHTISVEEVHQELVALLPQVPAPVGDNLRDFEQHLYSVQNDIVAALVKKRMNLIEFRHHSEGESPKQIAPETIDRVVQETITKNFNNDAASFHAFLAAKGTTLEQHRKAVEDDVIYSYMRAQQRRVAKSLAAKRASPQTK